MTITQATDFFKQRGLFHRGELGELKGTSLAVDGHLWLKNLQYHFKEPWHMAMGGIPLSLHSVVDKDLEKFRKWDIRPLFIFNGINLQTATQFNLEGKPVSSSWVQSVGFKEYSKREQAWKHYYEDNYQAAKADFSAAGSGVTSADTLDAVIKYFRTKDIEFFRAPYLAWAQCAWFCGQHDQVCANIWGSEEILMFIGLCQFDRLIVRVEFDKQYYEWLSLHEVCQQLGGLSVSQFIDCCLLVGCKNYFLRGMSYSNSEDTPPGSTAEEQLKEGYSTNIPNNPGLAQQLLSQPNVKFAQSMRNLEGVAKEILSCRTGAALLEMRVRYFQLDTMYLHHVLEQFLRFKNLVIHHIVLSTACIALPISTHNCTLPDPERNPYGNPPSAKYNIINNIVPNNLHTIIGPRLPNMVYFFLAIGLVSPQVINNVVHNTMIEYLPTVDSTEYRELLQKIVPLRTQIAYLLINCMMRKDETYWKVAPHGGSRPIMNYIQWHTEKTIALHTPPELLLDDWDVSRLPLLREEIPREPTTGSAIINFVSVLPFSKCALKACSPPGSTDSPKTYGSLEEITCVILLKSLDLLGYFTPPPQQRPVGTEESGTSLFAEALSEVNWKYAEQGVLLIELLRTGALNCSALNTPPLSTAAANEMMGSSQLVPITYNMDPRILLITRVLSILPMNLLSEEWGSNEVVRDLCAFHVLFKSLYKTLRNLCEIIMTVMFMDNRALVREPRDSPLDLFKELVQRLPFHETVNTAMGVVVFTLIDFHSKASTSKRLPADRWAALDMESKFPCCKDLRGDLSRAYGFWNESMKVVKKLFAGQAMAQSLHHQFTEADSLLQATFMAYSILPPAAPLPASGSIPTPTSAAPGATPNTAAT
eukprot:RCo022130